MAEQDEEEVEFTKKKKKKTQQLINGSEKCVWSIFIYSCMETVCVCICARVFRADVPTVDGPLSSIKKMSGLINHDTAHSPRGGRSVTCPPCPLPLCSATPG